MKLNSQELFDKIAGCYTGKNIGGTLGAPFECYRGVYDVSWFMQDTSSPVPNDDVDLQLVWLRAAEIEGRKIDSHILAEYWNTYVSATLAEYGTGKNNFNMGILPPVSGKLRNVNKDSNGAWIRTEIWACLCAGNPALAVNYAYYDSSVDHSDEGVYAAVFCAAMQAAAFFESNIYKLIDIGLSYIPENCAVTKAVNCVMQCFESGETWKQARKELFKVTPSSFGMMCGYWKGTAEVPACKECPVQSEDAEIPEAVHGFDAPWHIGAIVLGLLYGKGDFAKSICLAVNCGEDTDCTAGTIGSILGIIYGAKGLPENWVRACSDKIATWTLRIDQYLRLPKTIEEISVRILRLVPEFLGAYNCNLFPDFEVGKGMDFSGKNCFEITPVADFMYGKTRFDPIFQEDAKELISEQGSVVRKHFGLYTLLIKFDETHVKLQEGVEKKIGLEFLNMLFTPHYFTVRIIDAPEEWTFQNGREYCVGVEHWHGSTNNNSLELSFTPNGVSKGKYTFIIEISMNGRMTKNYVPVTFINGAC